MAFADIPLTINHQGLVKVNDAPFTGNGLFKFGIVDAGNLWLWTNDGTHIGQPAGTNQPDNGLTLPVSNGIYNVRLGDTSFLNMTSIPGSVFDTAETKLRILFNDGVNGWQLLAPDQTITASPYAFHALNSDSAASALYASAVPGALDGGVISNSSGDIVNDLAISEVWCSDSTNTYSMHVPGMIKRADASWQAGTQQGGMDAGTVGVADIIYIWVIGDSTGAQPGDFLFSTDDTDPLLPPGYNIKRLLGGRKWSGTEWVRFVTLGKGREKWVTLLDIQYMAGQRPPTTDWTSYNCAGSVPRTSRIIQVYGVASQDSDASPITLRFRPVGGAYDGGAVFVRGPHSAAPSNQVGATALLTLDEFGVFEWRVDNVPPGTGTVQFTLTGYIEML